MHPKGFRANPTSRSRGDGSRFSLTGRFWHGHPDHFVPGKSGEYWGRKIARTQQRDRLANEALEGRGWIVLWFWDFEVENDPDDVVRRVKAALAGRP